MLGDALHRNARTRSRLPAVATHALLITTGLLVSATAMANERNRTKLTDMGRDLATTIGVADYCDQNSGQRMVDAFARGLPHFKLSAAEIESVLKTTESRRKEVRAQTATTLSNQPCPADVREKVQGALHELEQAWYRAVKNDTGVDIQASATPAANQPSASGGLCVKGRAVSVLWGGSWYAAKVLDGPDRTGNCLISYDGYGSNWDEWVNASRMRPAASSSASSPAPSNSAPATAQTPSPSASSSSGKGSSSNVPTGKYNCYTFDAGQLNYTYTDIVIEAGNRYSVGNKGGTYTLDKHGGMSFTGTMSNAKGSFSIKSTGKAQIDLIFNGDPRSSMTCPKAR